jgi:glycosyltransferase involved in cell wall biosynthesis
MEIRTFIGKKLDYINGILRRQVELDRYLKENSNLKLSYYYYPKTYNPIDFISKRYILYPYYSVQLDKKRPKKTINHITYQYLGDLGHFLESSRTIITCHDVYNFLVRNDLKRPWFMQKYLLSGLKKCKSIIAISDFTKNEMINKLNVPKEKIVVIKNGINTDIFHPIPKETLLYKKKNILSRRS